MVSIGNLKETILRDVIAHRFVLVYLCIFKLDSTEGEYKVIVAWHIERGYFGNGDINLDNLNVVYAIYAPGNMFTGPKWKLALYVDDKASEQQKDALTKIYSGQVEGLFGAAANHVGEIMGIKSVPNRFCCRR
jgi:hypothetical protein